MSNFKSEISEKDLQRKEQELQFAIQQYHTYDLSALKQEIQSVLDQETKKLTNECRKKQTEITQKFNQIKQLSSEHISKGHKYDVSSKEEQQMDEKLIAEYERNSEKFERSVRNANQIKQALREDIVSLESEMRTMRDQLADKQSQNKALQFILGKEELLAVKKSELEEKALKILQNDLQDQLLTLQANSKKLNGKVTPLTMEQQLSLRLKSTVEEFEKFIAQSETDLADEELELQHLNQVLIKEQSIAKVLQQQKDSNQKELERLGKEFMSQKVLYDGLMVSYKNKAIELEQIRAKASDESRQLEIELGNAQAETNVLIMDLKKYEGLAGFMQLEKDLILQAMADAKGVDPGLAARGVEKSEQRRDQIAAEIEKMQKEWKGQLNQMRQEAESVLAEDQIMEFKTRIVILMQELEAKNLEIARVKSEKQLIEETVERTLDIEVDIREQASEISLLNDRYARALSSKITVYDQLVTSVSQLADRNSIFLKNEVELSRLSALTNITKLELEQKEKAIERKQGVDESSYDPLQKKIVEMNRSISEKDSVIEHLEMLLRRKENETARKRIDNQQIEGGGQVQEELFGEVAAFEDRRYDDITEFNI